MVICHVIAVFIVVTNQDRVSIRWVLHDVSKVFGERSYAIDSDNYRSEFEQAGLKKKEGLRRVKLLSNHLLLSKHQDP